MKQIGERIDDLEKRLDELVNGFDARIRAGIDKFVAEEKAKHELPGEKESDAPSAPTAAIESDSATAEKPNAE